MTRVYLAGRYSRGEEFRRYRKDLEDLGFIVTSRWIDHHNGSLKKSMTPAEIAASPEKAAAYAQADLDDVMKADHIIVFTEHEGGGKGGRHVEFGVGLLRHNVIVIGPMENVFYALVREQQYPNWEAFIKELRSLNGATSGPGSKKDDHAEQRAG